MKVTSVLVKFALGMAVCVAPVAIPGTAEAATNCSVQIAPDSAHLPGFKYWVCATRSGSYVSGRVQVKNYSASASYYVQSYYVKSSVSPGGAVTCGGGWVGPGQSFYCDSLSMYDEFGGLDYGSGQVTYWDPVGANYLAAATGSPWV
jgi:hypothetical protein